MLITNQHVTRISYNLMPNYHVLTIANLTYKHTVRND